MKEQLVVAPLRTLAQPCPYLPGREARYEHFLLVEGGEEGVSRLIESGFRHFGHYYFRPACVGLPGAAWCGACIPLRVNINDFRPSKTQRRVLRRGAAIEMKVGLPKYSEEKFEIYCRHKERFKATGPAHEETAESFRDSFYESGELVRECVYRLEGRIIAVSFLDITRRAASSIYCAFDPDFEQWSPGVLSVLREIEYSRQHGIPYYYLGYWVNANKSLRYKADYRPCEIFDGTHWNLLRDEDGTARQDPEAARTMPFAPLL